MAYQNYTLEQLQKIDARHHMHPFCDYQELRQNGTRVISNCDGNYVIDSEGERLLDAMAGLWCVNIGYSRPELAEVARQQMLELPYYNSFFQCTTPAPILLSEKLIDLAPPGIENVFYGSSGSESNDTVLRLVRHYWALEGKPERQIVISRHNAYHGSTVAAASLGGMSAMHGQLHTMVPGIHHIMSPYHFGEGLPGESEADFGVRAAQALEDEILRIGADKVAAFIAEPIQGAGGVRVPPATYWPEIKRICDKYDILLCLDEVISGFGRTGEWFAATCYDIQPDTITTAKAITSGYIPLSAVLVGKRISDTLIRAGGEFYHGYTYSGHPVACAVALENLRIIQEEGMVERVKNETGPYLAEKLAQFDSHPIVGEVRAYGFLAAIEIVADKQTKERFEGDGAAGVVCRDLCLENQLIMRAVGDAMIMSPPLTWDRATIDEAVEKIGRVLDQAQKRLTA